MKKLMVLLLIVTLFTVSGCQTARNLKLCQAEIAKMESDAEGRKASMKTIVNSMRAEFRKSKEANRSLQADLKKLQDHLSDVMKGKKKNRAALEKAITDSLKLGIEKKALQEKLNTAEAENKQLAAKIVHLKNEATAKHKMAKDMMEKAQKAIEGMRGDLVKTRNQLSATKEAKKKDRAALDKAIRDSLKLGIEKKSLQKKLSLEKKALQERFSAVKKAAQVRLSAVKKAVQERLSAVEKAAQKRLSVVEKATQERLSVVEEAAKELIWSLQNEIAKLKKQVAELKAKAAANKPDDKQ